MTLNLMLNFQLVLTIKSNKNYNSDVNKLYQSYNFCYLFQISSQMFIIIRNETSIKNIEGFQNNFNNIFVSNYQLF